MHAAMGGPGRWRHSAALQCDAQLLRAKSEEVRSGCVFSPGLRLLALGFEPMVDQALRGV